MSRTLKQRLKDEIASHQHLLDHPAASRFLRNKSREEQGLLKGALAEIEKLEKKVKSLTKPETCDCVDGHAAHCRVGFG